MRRLSRESLTQLLDYPVSRGARGHVEVEDSPPPVVDGEPDVEEPETDARDDEGLCRVPGEEP